MPRKGRISSHFFWSEFKCKCGKCTMPPEVQKNIERLVVRVLQPLRDFLGVPIKITSGYRCDRHNKAVWGARHSQHMKGTAADIVVDGMRAVCVYRVLDGHMRVHRLGPGGVGRYPTRFTHLDIRPTKRAVRW